MFKIVHMMGCMSGPGFSLPASDTPVLLASGEDFRYCAHSDMTMFVLLSYGEVLGTGTGSGNKATTYCAMK